MRSYTISPHTLRVTETAEALFNILEQQTETADLREKPQICGRETADLRLYHLPFTTWKKKRKHTARAKVVKGFLCT